MKNHLKTLTCKDIAHIVLSDGNILVTILLCDPNQPRQRGTNPRSLIFEISPALKIKRWPPGRHYTTGSIWYTDKMDNLYGWDFLQPNHIYVCRHNGKHVADLDIPQARKGLLKPRYFSVHGDSVRWMDPTGHRRTTRWAALTCAQARLRPSTKSGIKHPRLKP